MFNFVLMERLLSAEILNEIAHFDLAPDRTGKMMTMMKTKTTMSAKARKNAIETVNGANSRTV